MENTPELSQASHIDETTLVPEEEPKPVVLRASIDVRNVSLALLSVIGVIFFLDWAQEVIIPLLLGIIISYALSPLVTFMHKWGIPRALGAGIIIVPDFPLGSTAAAQRTESAREQMKNSLSP